MAFDYITAGPPIIPAPVQPALLFDKTNDIVYVSTMPTAQNAPAWVPIGTSASISINSALVSSANLNNTTPAAPGGKVNIIWQRSGNNVSAYADGATPGGSDKQVQFDNAGAFGGSSEFIWDRNNTISATHTLNIGNRTDPSFYNSRLLTNDLFTGSVPGGSYSGIVSSQTLNLTGDQSANEFASMATSTSFGGDATYGGIFCFDLNVLYNGTGTGAALYGFYSAMNTNPGTNTNALIPLYAGAASAGTCAQINGVFSGVQHSAGTATEAAGVRISLDISGIVTELYGVKIDDLGLGGGTITRYRAVDIGDVTTGSGTNSDPWAIYSHGGNSYFRDSLYVGTTQTTATTPVNRTRITGGTGYSPIASIEMNGQGIIAIREVATHSFITSTTDFSGLNTAAIQISRVWNPATPLVNLVLTSVSSAIGNDAVYHGTITGGAANAYAGATVIVFGFTNGVNNGIFLCDASDATSLTLVNPSASAETHAATAFTGGESFNGITNHVLIDDSSTKNLTNAQIAGAENQIWLQGFTTGGVVHAVDGVVYSQPSTTGTMQFDEIKCVYTEVLFGGVAASTHNATLVVGLNAGTHGWLSPSVGTIGTSWAINIEGPRLPAGTTMSTRKGIRIASQAQAAGGTNTDPWGIYEENATEKNALGKINLGGASGPLMSSGTGSPEGVVTAPVGSIFLRTNGGAGTTFYVKESGAGNTGWVGK